MCAGLDTLAIYALLKKTRWWHIARLAFPLRSLVSFDRVASWLRKVIDDQRIEELRTPLQTHEPLLSNQR